MRKGCIRESGDPDQLDVAARIGTYASYASKCEMEGRKSDATTALGKLSRQRLVRDLYVCFPAGSASRDDVDGTALN